MLPHALYSQRFAAHVLYAQLQSPKTQQHFVKQHGKDDNPQNQAAINCQHSQAEEVCGTTFRQQAEYV